MVPKNDHFLVGFLAGLVIPVVAYAILLQVLDYFSAGVGRTIAFQPRTLALMGLCLNILPMNIFRRTYRNRALRGLVTATVSLAVVWFFWYGRSLL